MKHLTRTAAIIATTTALTIGALPAANAGHNIGEWFDPRGWICAAVPAWC